MINLGGYYFLKGPNRKGRDKGGKRFKLCAEKNHVGCQENLALVHFAGYGRPPDIERAAEWMAIVAKNGSHLATGWFDNYCKGRAPITRPNTQTDNQIY